MLDTSTVHVSVCTNLLYASASAIFDLISDLFYELLLLLPLLVLQTKRLVLHYVEGEGERGGGGERERGGGGREEGGGGARR